MKERKLFEFAGESDFTVLLNSSNFIKYIRFYYTQFILVAISLCRNFIDTSLVSFVIILQCCQGLCDFSASYQILGALGMVQNEGRSVW